MTTTKLSADYWRRIKLLRLYVVYGVPIFWGIFLIHLVNSVFFHHPLVTTIVVSVMLLLCPATFCTRPLRRSICPACGKRFFVKVIPEGVAIDYPPLSSKACANCNTKIGSLAA